MSQADVARMTQLSGPTISHIEAGGPQPRSYNLEKIAKALEVHLDALHFDVVCLREVLRITGVSVDDVAELPNVETTLTRTARELSRQLSPAQDEHAATLLKGLVGFQLAAPGGQVQTSAAAPAQGVEGDGKRKGEP